MTEADWLTGTDFTAHARYASERLSPRRQRLLAAGFCRATAHFFSHPELNSAIDVVERYADGLASAADVEKTRQRCREIATESYEAYTALVDGDGSAPNWATPDDGVEPHMRHEFAWAVAYAASSPLTVADVGKRAREAAVEALTGEVLVLTIPSHEYTAAEVGQSLAMRAVVWEVAGNPFRPVHFSPSWRTDTSRALARHIYDRRDFGAMPILADALQDAGCESEDVLNHCRDASCGHVRGCWVVDLVLGNE